MTSEKKKAKSEKGKTGRANTPSPPRDTLPRFGYRQGHVRR